MAEIILPRGIRAQPQHVAPFAAGHNPGACFLGSSAVELVGRQSRVESNLLDGVRTCGRVRVAANQSSSDTYPVNVPALTDFTLYLYTSHASSGEFWQYLLGFSDTGGGGNYLGIPAAHQDLSGCWGLFIGVSGVNTFLSSGEIFPQNQLTAIVITRSGSTIKLFRDGVLKNTVIKSDALNPLTNLTLNSFGMASGAGSGSGTYFALAGVEPMAWADGEVRRFSANPWSLFKASARRLWAVSSSSTNYTLTADPFSLTFTGTDANLEYNSVLSADSASLSFDVADATLKRGYSLTADPVSLDFSGADAALKYNRVLQADAAAIQLTGADVSLEYSRALQADPATIQFDVADATLTYTQPGNYVLTAEPVTLGFAVADASLKYDRKLSADPAELAFNGPDASLRYARVVIAEATQIAFTAADATLSRTGGPEPITSIVERTAIFRRTKSVTVRFN